MQHTAVQTNSIKPWLMAARPKSLPLSVLPVMAATLLALAKGFKIDWIIPLSATLAAMFIQIGTNVINDGLDFSQGKDTKDRLGFLRVTQMGLLTFRQVYWGGIACFGLALLLSVPLFMKGGIPLVIVLIASVLAGYLYTGGPFPLAYHGLGEPFVLIFFGWVLTASVYFLQSASVDAQAMVLGTQCGLLAIVLLSIANFRDIAEDSKTGKRTLAVRFGPLFARCEIIGGLLVAYGLNFYWLTEGYLLAFILPYLSLPIAINLILKIWKNDPSRLYNKFFGFAALVQITFMLMLCLGFALVK